jgi:hypothetical protein
MNAINRGQASTITIGGTQNPNVVLANAGYIPQVHSQKVLPHPSNPPNELDAVAIDVDVMDSMSIVPGGQPGFVQNPAPTVPAGNLIQTMYNLLENPRCSNFISSLINTARQLTGNKPLSYSAKELIGMIGSNADGGYFFIPGYSGGRGGGEAGRGTGVASATIGGQSYLSGTPRSHLLRVQVGYALTGLHETIHLAGIGYSDIILAQAVFAMFGNAADDPSKVKASPRAVYDYGGIWDKYLQEYCGGTPFNGDGLDLGTVP